jgi:hypothetical protein
MVIEASGNDLASTGLSKKQILKAFLSSPSLLQKFQETAGEAVSPYQQFDPSHVYNPTEVANSVQYKYMSMGQKFQPFVQDYWKAIAKDTSPAGINKTLATTRERIPLMAKEYGLSEQEINDILTPMQDPKEISSFQKVEASRQKAQFKAFNEQKVKLGIKSKDTAGEDYLQKLTGLKGLSEVPNNEQFVEKKTQDFLKIIKEKGVTDPYATAEYEKLFKTGLTSGLKKSKKSAASFSKADLIKKNLGNL